MRFKFIFVSAYRLSCYSLESKCAFPFELEGVNHSQCWTTSRVTPWCATTSDYENAHQWINCTYCQSKLFHTFRFTLNLVTHRIAKNLILIFFQLLVVQPHQNASFPSPIWEKRTLLVHQLIISGTAISRGVRYNQNCLMLLLSIRRGKIAKIVLVRVVTKRYCKLLFLVDL